MAKLLLLNPKPRKRKKARTAKQKAATKRMIAANRKRLAPKRRSNPRKTIKRTTTMAKRRKPYRMTAGRKRAIAKLKAFNRSRRKTNPVRRRRVSRRPARTIRGYRRGRARPAYRSRRRVVRRRNPVTARSIQNTVIDAFQASLGALSLDWIWGMVPVPIEWKTGQFRHLVKGAGAIGMGMIAEMIVSKPQANKMVHGAMTVVMHDALKEFIQMNVPQIQLGYYSPAMTTNGLGMYMGHAGSDRLSGVGSDRLGAYVGGSMTSPYLSPRNLSTPFAGPSAAQVAADHCPRESEGNMGQYF